MFAGLSEDDRKGIAGVAVTRGYQRGELVHQPGDRSALRIVHRGAVKVHRVNELGGEQVLRILHPGDFLGETTLLTGRPVDSSAVALEPAEVCAVSGRDMARLLRERPDVAIRMLATLSARLDSAEHQLSAVTGASVRARLAGRLIELAEADGSATFRLPSTKKDLASFLGTTPETLSRRLHDLAAEGLIRLDSGGVVEVPDLERLRAAAGG